MTGIVIKPFINVFILPSYMTAALPIMTGHSGLHSMTGAGHSGLHSMTGAGHSGLRSMTGAGHSGLHQYDWRWSFRFAQYD